MNYILKLRLADLSFTPSIKNTDFFVVSRFSDAYESKKLSFMVYKSTLFNTLASLSSFTPNGTFDFDSANGLLINSTSITSLSSVVNVSEGRNLLNYLTNLSAMVYGTSTIEYKDENDEIVETTEFPNVNGEEKYFPSYVGQVLILDKNYTEQQLSLIYGNHTHWVQQAQGRLILGAGKIESNNLNTFGKITKPSTKFNNEDMGGEISVVLNNIPSHSHKFMGAGWEYPKMKFGDFPEGNLIFNLYAKNKVSYTKIEANFDYHVHFDKVTQHGNYLHGPNNASVYAVNLPTPELSIIKIDDKEVQHTFTFTPKGEIAVNKTKKLGHNNMPPYEPMYVWERVQ